MPEALPEIVRAVGLALVRIGDRQPEAFPRALGDVERVGRRAALVGQLSIQRVHVDPKPHVAPSTVGKGAPGGWGANPRLPGGRSGNAPPALCWEVFAPAQARRPRSPGKGPAAPRGAFEPFKKCFP